MITKNNITEILNKNIGTYWKTYYDEMRTQISELFNNIGLHANVIDVNDTGKKEIRIYYTHTLKNRNGSKKEELVLCPFYLSYDNQEDRNHKVISYSFDMDESVFNKKLSEIITKVNNYRTIDTKNLEMVEEVKSFIQTKYNLSEKECFDFVTKVLVNN